MNLSSSAEHENDESHESESRGKMLHVGKQKSHVGLRCEGLILRRSCLRDGGHARWKLSSARVWKTEGAAVAVKSLRGPRDSQQTI